MGRLIIALLFTIACSRTDAGAEKSSAPASAAPPKQGAEAPAPPEATATAAPPAVTGAPPRHLVAVGDLHGDIENAIAVLRLAGVTDAQGRWTGGETVLVQTGDIVDRGPDSKAVVELLIALQSEAAAAGGAVYPLLGNHEVMNMTGDWRYVSEEDIGRFGSEAARKEAFSASGALGAWLRQRDAVLRLGGVIFVHGGVSEAFASRGAAGLSAAVRAAIDGQGPPDVLGPEGPLWYRGYALNDEPLACAELGRALPALGATRMVVGHTTQRSGKILSRCDGQLLAIDTGISAHYGAHLAALELRDGDAFALYPTATVDLPDP